MCTGLVSGVYEGLKKALIYCIIVIWINNSAFSLIALLLKIIGYVKSRMIATKVESEEKTEKRIIITN